MILNQTILDDRDKFGLSHPDSVHHRSKPQPRAGSFRRTLQSSRTGPSVYIGLEGCSSYVAWRACAATPLSGLS